MTRDEEIKYRLEFVALLSSCLEAISRGESFRMIVEPWFNNADATCGIQLDYEDGPFRTALIPSSAFVDEIRDVLGVLANNPREGRNK